MFLDFENGICHVFGFRDFDHGIRERLVLNEMFFALPATTREEFREGFFNAQKDKKRCSSFSWKQMRKNPW